MPSELQYELRELWKKHRPKTSDEILDAYFNEVYNPAELSIMRNASGEMTACCQMLLRKMTLCNRNISIGIIAATAICPSLKAAERTQAARNALTLLHQRMAQKGALISIAFPKDSEERKTLEACGYAMASHIIEADPNTPEAGNAMPDVSIQEETEWGNDLWNFYNRNGGRHDFEVKMSEGDFFALIAQNDAAGGSLIVARRKKNIVGLALMRREGKPLKNGKASTKNFRVRIPFILALQEDGFFDLIRHAKIAYPDCKQTLVSTACPPKAFEGSRPYAMVRAIQAEKFMTEMARQMPGLQLEIAIANDDDLPENNGGYRIIKGRCHRHTQTPESTTTPGGVPALFMVGRPAVIPPVFVSE